MVPFTMDKSEWHTPVATIRMSTSLAFGSSSSKSSTITGFVVFVDNRSFRAHLIRSSSFILQTETGLGVRWTKRCPALSGLSTCPLVLTYLSTSISQKEAELIIIPIKYGGAAMV